MRITPVVVRTCSPVPFPITRERDTDPIFAARFRAVLTLGAATRAVDRFAPPALPGPHPLLAAGYLIVVLSPFPRRILRAAPALTVRCDPPVRDATARFRALRMPPPLENRPLLSLRIGITASGSELTHCCAEQPRHVPRPAKQFFDPLFVQLRVHLQKPLLNLFETFRRRHD